MTRPTDVFSTMISPFFPRARHILGIALAVAVNALGYEQVAPPSDVVLPEPCSPAESLAMIRVPAGFRVELVAAEPQVMDPIDIAWGTDGRMWVVEMADYPNGIDDQGRPGGRVRVLESTKGDGVYDKSTLFADHLSFPNSVAPWRSGVLVAAAPDILYLEDTDGDGRADRVEKRFSGFAEGNQQHRANGLQWGLDGWLYMANGDSGGRITSPQSPRPLELGRRDLRIAPDAGAFEPVSGHTQWGRNRDDWGNWFSGNNSNPIWHLALEDRYLARNPHVAAPRAAVSVSEIPGPAPVYPVSKPMARFNDAARLNHFTSACGTMVYRDDLLGPEFSGNIFVCEPVHNLVHRQVLRPAGVTFAGQRASGERESEFFASADNWSRFTAARTGPDGALYVIDMYRLTIEHPKWIPEAWLKILGGVRAGSDRGRIYRVVRDGVPLRRVPRLDRADVSGLIAALDAPNGTVRDLAQQELTWRGDRAAAPRLEQLAAEAARPQTRVLALCTLDTLGVLRPFAVARGLVDPHPGVVRHAVRLAENFAAAGDKELLSAIVSLVDHPDPAVRQQVAYTLGEWTLPAAGIALARLVRENDDPFIRAAAMSSALPHAETLLAEPSAGDAPPAFIEIALATRNLKALARFLAGTVAPRDPSASAEQLTAFAALLEGLERHRLSLAAVAESAGAAKPRVLADATLVFAAARTIVSAPEETLVRRIAAVSLLGRETGRESTDAAALAALLGPQMPIGLQLAAVSALGRIDSDLTPTRLLSGWFGYGPRIRAAVFEVLAGRPAWARALLDRLEADAAMRAQLEPSRRAALIRHGDVAVASRASRIFGGEGTAGRQEIIASYLKAMRALEGDRTRGAAVFTSSCAACHRFGRHAGQPIGPDLAGVKDRSADYLVTHILDPNRAVEDRYLLSTVATHDGRTLAGMITAEAGNSITLQSLDGTTRTILRRDVANVATAGRSLMPEGLEASVDPHAMADLVAFLADDGDSPKSKTSSN